MQDLMRLEMRSTGRLFGLQELKNQGMGTGLSLSKGKLMMEESAGGCLRQRDAKFKPGWTPFGVIICG
jgi:hypothetical protein